MTTFTVPTVDLATQPLSDFVSALRRSSCVFITGHGVSDGLMTAMVDVSTEFFDLPRDLKAPTRWPGDGLWRGWQPVHEGAADLTGGRVPDLLERFEVALSGRARGDPGRARRQRGHVLPLAVRHLAASRRCGPATTPRSGTSRTG